MKRRTGKRENMLKKREGRENISGKLRLKG
jgi:hypothetical protein